jgi:uncharacterized membrane protein HdeD (DUF308 family)
METEHQVPIWFFVGGTLLIYGVIILGAGLYALVDPSQDANIAMRYLHADIWWGAVMAVVGAFYTVRFFPWRKTDKQD